MSAADDNTTCPLCGHVGRMQISTRQPPAWPPHKLNPPLLELLQCRACGTIFAKCDQRLTDEETAEASAEVA